METHLRSASDLLARNLLRCSRHNGAAGYGQCDSPIPTRFITHQARRSYGCVLRKWTNSYCNEATNPLNARKNWSGWQELNLRGHVPKTCGWPLPYTRIWWLGTELNRIHWLFRPALCRRVPEPTLGGRCET